MSFKAENLSFSYKKENQILHQISVSFNPGEVTAIIGQNGSGKSTLLKCLNGILLPQQGRVILNHQDIKSLSLLERARMMSYVPQTIPGKLNLSVYDTVLMGRRPYIKWRVANRDLAVVDETLECLGLQDLAFYPYDELSGGQKQKVLIARALAQEPLVLIMDEPASNLDLKHQQELLSLVIRIAIDKNLYVIMTAHDLNLVINYAHSLVMMKQGHLYRQGPVSDVLTSHYIKDVFDVDTHVGDFEGVPFVILDNK